MRQHRTIYLSAIDQRRADRLARKRASATLLLATLAACLALSGPCAILYAATPGVPLPAPMRVALGIGGAVAILIAQHIASKLSKQ